MMLFKRFCISFTVIMIILVLSSALAQPVEQTETSKNPYSALPDIQSYVAFCKAVYWENARENQSIGKELVNTRDELMKAIQFSPRSSFLYTKMAKTLIIMSDLKKAEFSCNRALILNPNNDEAHYLLGILKLGDPKVAVAEFKKATELNPEHIGAQYRLGRMLFEAEDYVGAARSYSEMVKLRPYDPGLRHQLGLSYMRSGQVSEAIMEFNAALRLRGDDLDSHFQLAYLYARQSRNQEAIKECLFILERSPKEPNINLLLSELYVTTGEFDKAISILKKIIDWQRSEKNIVAEAYYRLASAYKGKGESALADQNFQKSVEIYEDYLQKNPKQIGIYYDLAMVYDSMGNRKLAEQYLRKHIRLKPDEPNAYNFLGYMFAENDMNLEEAVSLVMKAVEMDPQNGTFRDSLGWAYFKLGNLDKAIEELQKAVEFTPENSEIREHLGEVYRKKGGDFAGKAVLEWEKALEIKPENASLQQKLEKLCKSLESKEDENSATSLLHFDGS